MEKSDEMMPAEETIDEANDESKLADFTEKSAVLIGLEGVRALAHSTVMVIGLGGVGSSCALALARASVGHLILVDHDIVQASNINRQLIAFESTIGQRKTAVARALINDISPTINVTTHDLFVLPNNLEELIGKCSPQPDYLIDCIDTVTTKLALAEYAQTRGIPLVSSMGAANKCRPEMLEFADISKTENCPLCRVVRKEARLRGIKRLRVLYSREVPQHVKSADGASRYARSNLGTMSYFPAIMGFMLAGDVIQAILGMNEA